MANFYMLKEQEDLPRTAYKIDRTSLDLDFLTGQLVSLTDTLGALGDRCIALQQFETVIASFSPGASNIDDQFSTSCHLGNLRRFNRESAISAKIVVKYLESAVSAQVRQVYSLIGQKVNRLNMEAADAARQLSAVSRRISFVAGKDSANMRIIAAMTLIFLPGTFTATLLSSSFFNFKHGTQGIISEWIWLYWAITCILTVVVMGAWFLVSRKAIEIMKRVIEIEEGKAEASETERRTRESAHAFGLSKQLEDVTLSLQKLTRKC
ncbi:hypothetical protein BCR34DRAFT_653094 [Clohesyomyces aquaticus]|uniref:Uncharacterized protein n=1 Tax=Clohesyomyces aquaticus TaxID=1231657 RepID=A0A1Y1ZMU1_9PLEO|nr:hypothetical protein BCR34DRAFT_653094 [Clohesyomyces aquaticus]